MAAGITASYLGADRGPELRAANEIGEFWRLTADASSGSGAADTAAITTRFIKNGITKVVGGPFSVVVSGNVATITNLVTLGNSATVDVLIVGRP